MLPLQRVARKTGRAAALSAVSAGFFLSAAALLTLACVFLLAPIYGTGMALLIMGLIHLAIALIAGGAIALGGRHRSAEDHHDTSFEDHPAMSLMAAFLAGVNEGVAAGRAKGGQQKP